MKKDPSEKNKSKLRGALTCALTASVFALGALTAVSFHSLSALQKDVKELKLTVTEFKDLSERADQLAQLENSPIPTQSAAAAVPDKAAATPTAVPTQAASSAEHAAEDAEGPEPAPAGESQGQGTLSPPSGSSSLLGSGEPEIGTDEKLSALLTSLQGQLPGGNGSWSVYVSSLSNGSEGSLNNASMQAASLIKLFIMGAVYENYDALSASYGADNLNNQLYYMITVSDNDAANTLTRYLGGGDDAAGRNAVNQFCQNHGYVNTSMGRMLLASTEFGDNYTSVEDCGHFLKQVYEASMSETAAGSLAHASDMYNLLKQQQRRNKIPAQMPAGVGIANKTGELSNVENDAGILYNTARGEDLVVVFMSQNLSEVGSAQNSIAALSRMIYDSYNA